jgi:hypothetical protein
MPPWSWMLYIRPSRLSRSQSRYTVSHICAALNPSPHLQRLGSVRAARPFSSPRFVILRSRHDLNCPSELTLMWISKEHPSTDINYLRPVPVFLPRESDLRFCAAKRRTPSVCAVPPGFDGLLRKLPCKFISPCSQPWGSSCFVCGLPSAVLPRPLVLRELLELAPHTLQSFPLADSSVASPRPICLLTVGFSRCFQLAFPQSQGFTPSSSPLSPAGVATNVRPDALLGLVPLQGAPFLLTAHLDTPGAPPP